MLDAGTAVVPLPRNVSDKMAAPINCAMATMVNAVSNIPTDSNNSIAMIQVRVTILYFLSKLFSRLESDTDPTSQIVKNFHFKILVNIIWLD